ncbi:YopX family protein [Staphylococcus epidermidis]|uniref:YopX family protein n=1 Tax=Staphylococcus epidermidis TaxID=1282 RepID=UPI0028852890|nr:YopX family protein [Staphylococcus epidermidis]MDT0741667.1 YopX family protein [Staphylococcus epidermidis]
MIPKFRAWSKEREEMINDCDLSITPDGSVLAGDLNYDEESGMLADVTDNVVITMSTGLKDKNGTEIYEGDIIRGPYDTGIIGYEMVTTEVKYDLLKGFQLEQFDLNITEVIGNIYENPEKCRFVEREF